MDNVYSMTGAKSSGPHSWAWCVPGTLSPPATPICVLVMSPNGPRFLPTRIIAPESHRKHLGEYKEIQPSPADIRLAQAVLDWVLHYVDTKPSTKAITAAVALAHNVAAAERFLGTSEVRCTVPPRAVAERDLYFGRSVLVHFDGAPGPVAGWIASDEEPIDLVVRFPDDGFMKISADIDQLIEDGSGADHR